MAIEDIVLEKARNGKRWLYWIAIFIVIQGTIGFSMFICEEGMQTSMFASFAYKEAKDYNGLQNHLELMKSQAEFSEIFIKYVGWLSPLMYPAYLNYCVQNRAYIKSVESTLKSAKKAKQI